MKIFAEKALVGNRILQKVSIEVQGNIITKIKEQTRRNKENLYIGKEDLLIPLLVNSHTHLELSHLKGKIPEQEGMLRFLENVVKHRNDISSLENIYRNELRKAEVEGTKYFIDISNKVDTVPWKNSRIYTCLEVLGFAGDEEARTEEYLRIAREFEKAGLPMDFSPHAPYSLSDKMWELLRKIWENFPPKILSIHLLESEEERQLLEENQGDFRKFFDRDALTQAKSVTEVLRKNLPLFPQTTYLFVHLRVATETELEFLAKHYPNSYFVLCPRSNFYITGKIPDLTKFRKYARRILLGTDSLASNYDLSVWNEVKFLAKHFDLSLAEALNFTILNPSRFLGNPLIEVGNPAEFAVLRQADNLSESCVEKLF